MPGQTTGPGCLLREERRRKILELLESNGQLTVREIVQQFGVGPVTARGDLDALSKLGSVVRSHGGAVRAMDPRHDYPIQLKAALNHAEKVRIGAAAAQMIEGGQTVMLDSGSTTSEIALQIKRLKRESVTVITNALNIGDALVDAPAVSLIMIGGVLRPLSCSFVGPHAEHMLENLRADHFFLAADGVDLEAGPTTPDVLAAQLNQIMAERCEQVTLVADASKFGRRSVCVVCPFERIRRVITDSRIDSKITGMLRARGCEVIVV